MKIIVVNLNYFIEVKVGFNTTEIKDGTLTIYLESTGAEYEASGSIGFLVTLSSEVPGGKLLLF